MRIFIALAALAAILGTLVAHRGIDAPSAMAGHRATATATPSSSPDSTPTIPASTAEVIACIGMSSTNHICEGESANHGTDGLGFLDRFTGAERWEGVNLARGSTDIGDWATNAPRYNQGPIWTEWIPEQLAASNYSTANVVALVMWQGCRDGESVAELLSLYDAIFAWAFEGDPNDPNSDPIFPNLTTIYLTDTPQDANPDCDPENNQAVEAIWADAATYPFVVPCRVSDIAPNGDWLSPKDNRHPGSKMITDIGGRWYECVFSGEPPSPTATPPPTATPAPSPTSTPTPIPVLVTCERVATYSDGREERSPLPLTDC